MTISLDAAISSVRERGLIALRLKADPDEDNAFWEFEGSTEEFLDALKAMESKVVYVVAETFEEDSLLHSAEEDADYDDNVPDEINERVGPIDLVAGEPALAEYRSRVGEHYCLSLLAMTVEAKLRLDIWAPWYEDFLSLKSSALESLLVSAEERQTIHESSLARERDAQRTTLLQELEKLPPDPAFRGLPTKGAMTAYIVEHFPSVKAQLGPAAFRETMTLLHQRALLERARR